MNGQLSFESVNVCHSGSPLNLVGTSELLAPAGTPGTIQDCKMQSRPLDPRKPMLLLAGCLMVASVVPMFVVVAAG